MASYTNADLIRFARKPLGIEVLPRESRESALVPEADPLFDGREQTARLLTEARGALDHANNLSKQNNTSNLLNLESRLASLNQGRADRPSLRSVTQPLDAVGQSLSVASFPALAGGPIPSGALMTAGAVMSAPDMLRRLISPDEDESRGGAALDVSLAALPVAIKGLRGAVRGGKSASTAMSAPAAASGSRTTVTSGMRVTNMGTRTNIPREPLGLGAAPVEEVAAPLRVGSGATPGARALGTGSGSRRPLRLGAVPEQGPAIELPSDASALAPRGPSAGPVDELASFNSMVANAAQEPLVARTPRAASKNLRRGRPTASDPKVEAMAQAAAPAPVDKPLTPDQVEAMLNESDVFSPFVLQNTDELATSINASGDSAASVEALKRMAGMANRGEQFVVYGRDGSLRRLTGPEAVDYVARPGERYGVMDKSGFRLLSAGERIKGRR